MNLAALNLISRSAPPSQQPCGRNHCGRPLTFARFRGRDARICGAVRPGLALAILDPAEGVATNGGLLQRKRRNSNSDANFLPKLAFEQSTAKKNAPGFDMSSFSEARATLVSPGQ